ncbi:TonB family protein [Pleionea mediterranea]|uniref:TonB family protein n=1 Tax=Pleionea mediterranea TaxID=523701 RepID=A0A316FXU1_9GAMM|nr:TonB family protein [Pleionea mediterranea]PWK53409.1 TonB family protein [Pleionea mediterranea]
MALGRFISGYLFALICITSVSAAEQVTLADGSSLELKGIGVASEFRTDIYIGALYAPVGLESLSLIKDINTPKRIEVRYLADNYSYRKVSRHFKERIAMNNDREIWQPMTREIVTFSRLFKQNFVTGDEIRIDFIPGRGSEVYLNDTLFETIENPQLFNLLLESWVGSVPPSKSFKQGILGELSDSEQSSIIQRYESLTPVTGRFTLSTPQVAETTESKPTANKQPQQTKVPEKTPPKQVAKKTEPKKVETQKPTPKKTVTNTKPTPKKQVAETKTPEKKPAEISQTPKKKQVTETSKPKQPPATKAEPEPVVEDDFIDEDLIRGAYVRELIAEVKQYQEYPRQALIDRDEGDVLVKVTIDRQGEVINTNLLERSGSRTLDKAVLKMVRRASPFAAMPPELSGEQFEFEIPFSFQL